MLAAIVGNSDPPAAFGPFIALVIHASAMFPITPLAAVASAPSVQTVPVALVPRFTGDWSALSTRTALDAPLA
jgi:hypothetical protein